MRGALHIAALTLALLYTPAFAQDDLFAPAPKPPADKPSPAQAKAAPDGRSALAGTWKLDSRGGIQCGDGTIIITRNASGKLSGYADVGMTDPTSDFREISLSGQTVTITYGYANMLSGDPRVKTLSGEIDDALTTIRGTQFGRDVDGCRFTMTKQ